MRRKFLLGMLLGMFLSVSHGVVAAEVPAFDELGEFAAWNAQPPMNPLPGCFIPASKVDCWGTIYNDTGCAITCPINKTPVCNKAKCNRWYLEDSNCACK